MTSRGEPYAYVNALFDADLHTTLPNHAPREDWVIVSPTKLRYLGHTAAEGVQQYALVITFVNPDKDD